MYLGSFCAMVLKVRFIESHYSNSRLKNVMNVCFGIFSTLLSNFSDFLMNSNNIFLKIIGTLQTSLQTASKSSYLISSPLP
jgi:hypothetical protein